MKNVRRGILASLFTCLLSIGFSQTPLRINQANGSTWPSTAALGDTFLLNVAVRADTIAPTFNGFGGFVYSINGITDFNDTTTIKGIAFIPDTLLAGDSIIRQLKVNVTGPAFIVGPSVVVIWPIAFNSYARDSLRYLFEVTDMGVGIQEIDKNTLRIATLDTKLWIIKAPETTLNRVRIYNILGEKIIDTESSSETIALPALSAGVYVAEISYDNNQRKVFKFYR